MSNASRGNRREPPDPATTLLAAPADFSLGLWSRLSKHHTERLLQILIALLRHGEAIGMAQFNAAHLALERHRTLQQRLQDAHSPEELLGLQADLWRLDSAASTRYCQDMFNAASQLSAEMLRCQLEIFPSGQSEAMETAFQAMQNSLHTGIPPFDDLFNATFNLDHLVPVGERPH